MEVMCFIVHTRDHGPLWRPNAADSRDAHKPYRPDVYAPVRLEASICLTM